VQRNPRGLGTRLAIRAGVVLTLVAGGLVATATPSFAAEAISLSRTKIPSGGGFTLTITDTGTGVTMPAPGGTAVQFQLKTVAAPACNAAAQSPATLIASSGQVTAGVVDATVTATDNTLDTVTVTVPTAASSLILPPGVDSADFNVCVYETTGPSLLLSSQAAAGVLTVVAGATMSVSTGPTTGGNSLTLTTSSPVLVTGSSYVQFQKITGTVTCTAVVAGSVPAGALVPTSSRVLLPDRMTITFGTLTATAADTFQACIYGSSTAGSPLIAGSSSATASLYVTNLGSTVTSISPSAGPPQGNVTVVVTGSGFAPGMTASIGGANMNIVAIAADGNSFRAAVPPHSVGGPYAVTVTTPGGTVISKQAFFTYGNGIKATPDTAPPTKMQPTYVDLTGVGFAGLGFVDTSGATPNNTGAHVYLVKGAYNPTAIGTGATATKTNGQVTECVDVLVLQDDDMVCTLWTAGNTNSSWGASPPAGTSRTMTGCTAAASATQLTLGTGCTFTLADVGASITSSLASSIPANTTITAVDATGKPTLSAPNGTAAVVAGTTLTVATSRTVTGPTNASASATLASTTAYFSQYDVGRTITGANIPDYTTIKAVSADGKTATLSASSTAAVANTTPLQIANANPLPVGTYTITVVSNGAVGATGVSQSIISSGSTFTIADFAH
jgi:hypothetical protein